MMECKSYDTMKSEVDSNQMINRSDAKNTTRSESANAYEGTYHGRSRLVPAYLEDLIRHPKLAELRVAYDAPTNQTTYTYKICWDDSSDSRECYDEVMKTRHELRRRPAQAKDENSIPVDTLCDGPCRKTFPSNTMNSIGRCGHYLCNACYGIVINSDGTKGCSSLACNWIGKTESVAKIAYENQICKKQRLKARDMKERGITGVKPASSFQHTPTMDVTTASPSCSTSETDCSTPCKQSSTTGAPTTDLATTNSSNKTTRSVVSLEQSVRRFGRLTYPSECEMITAKLILIEKNPSNAYIRIVCQLEIATDTDLKKALSQMLTEKVRDVQGYLKNGKLFSVEYREDGTKQLVKVGPNMLEKAKLYQFPQIKEYVYFVLDMAGYAKHGIVKLSIDIEDKQILKYQ